MNRHRRNVVAVSVLWLAAFARLWDLGAQSLWMDEAFTHVFAVLPLDVAWQAMIVDAVHPPLYYLLMRPWLACVGESPFALRFPAAASGVLTVALLYRIGRIWLGRRSVGWAAALLALNPFHIWYSQEARMYALLALLSLAVMGAFWWAVESQRPLAWWCLLGVSALAYLTHYFAFYLPLVEFAFLLATFRRHHQSLLRWTMAQLLSVLPLAVWLVALYTVGGGTFGIGWILRPQPVDLLKTLWGFGMAYDSRMTFWVVMGLLVWGGGLVMGVWRGSDQAAVRIFLGLSLALPLLATYWLSLHRPTYVDRFFIGSLPAFLLLAAAGLARMPRQARGIAGLVLISLGLWGLVRFHTDPLFAKEDWRAVATYVEAREREGDGLALRYFQDVIPFRYYYRGALDLKAVTLNRQTTALEEIAAGHERLWLIFRVSHANPHQLAWSKPFVLEQDETEPSVLAWIAARCPDEVANFPGITVMRFDLGSDS